MCVYVCVCVFALIISFHSNAFSSISCKTLTIHKFDTTCYTFIRSLHYNTCSNNMLVKHTHTYTLTNTHTYIHLPTHTHTGVFILYSSKAM